MKAIVLMLNEMDEDIETMRKIYNLAYSNLFATPEDAPGRQDCIDNLREAEKCISKNYYALEEIYEQRRIANGQQSKISK